MYDINSNEVIRDLAEENALRKALEIILESESLEDAAQKIKTLLI